MRNHGIGIIGYGDFGEFVRNSWQTLDGASVIAVADTDPERDPGDLAFYDDWHALLRRQDIEIVVIGTPPSTHAMIAKAAVQAGKNVLVEKPPAITVPDAEELAALANESRKIVAVDYMLRYNPLVEALHQIGRRGLLGRLQHVSIVNYAKDSNLPAEHWFWNKDISGGIFAEHAVHFFDLVTFISGSPPVRVVADTVSRQPGMEDKVVAIVEHEDGLIATHYHHFWRPWWFERQSFRFAYDLGEIDVEGWIPLSGAARVLATAESREQMLHLFPARNVTDAGIEESPVRAGSHAFEAEQMLSFDFALQRAAGQVDVEGPFADVLDALKLEVYANCVRSSMADIVACISSPGQLPLNAIQNVMDSVRIACRARDFAQSGHGAMGS